MIKYKEFEQTKKYKMPQSITCDVCGKTKSYVSDASFETMEANNFITIKKSFGYGSEVGDEDTIQIDICEQCLIEKFGKDFILQHIKNYEE